MALSSLITVTKRRSRPFRLLAELVGALDTATGHTHDGVDSQALAPSGNTLDQSYDQGGAGVGRSITVDTGAVALTNNAANNNNVLELAKNPVGAQSGVGLLITIGANSTGAGIQVTNTGSGADIRGNAGNWSISAAGVYTGVAASLGTNPASAGTVRMGNAEWLAARDAANAADVNIIRVNGVDSIELANVTTSILGNATFGGTLTVTGATTLNGALTLNAGGSVDLNGTELILDADADTSITADTDDTIDIRVAGGDDFQITANTFTVLAGSVMAMADDVLLQLGSVARFSWDTTDANANALMLQLPAGGGVDVPVVAIGQSIESVDLGLFNGVVDPTVAIFGIGAVATGPRLRVYKARGTIAAPTVVTSGDDLFSIDAFGAVAAGEYVQAARILFEMTGTIATTRGPGVITFQTATDAAPSVLTTSMVINANQSVTFGVAPNATGVLRVANNVWLSAENNAGAGNVNLISANASDLVAFGANVAAFTAAGDVTLSGANLVVAANQVTLSTGTVVFSGAGSVDLAATGFLAVGATEAAAGGIRIANATAIGWRNAAGAADFSLTLDASDDWVLAGAAPVLALNATSGDPTIAFRENSVNDVYRLYYDITNNWWALWTTNSDGAGADADVIRIPDGQLTIDGNATFDGGAFDYVCEMCGYHDQKSLECPRCGHEMVWQDDTKLAYKLSRIIGTPQRTGAYSRDDAQLLARMGLLHHYEDGGYFIPFQTTHLFEFSAIAQLGERVESLERELAEARHELSLVRG